MVTAGMRSTASKRLVFGRLVIALELTWMSLSITRGGLTKFMPRLERQFSGRNRDILMNAQCPYKCWSALKTAVFGSSTDSSLSPPIGGVGGWGWSGLWVGCKGRNAVGPL